jgi:uncharacterized protein YaeQ
VALPSTRLEYRLTLSNVDRGVDLSRTLVVARHPSETQEHVTLRVLAFCLLNEERLELGPGLSTPDAADLWARDLTGQLTTWIECGAASAEALVKVLQHNAGASVHAVFGDERRRDELLAEFASFKRPRKGTEQISLWTIDRALVTALAAEEERRQQWTVTISGDHFYVEADGRSVDGEVARSQPPPPGQSG